MYAEDSIELLKHSGIDFAKHEVSLSARTTKRAMLGSLHGSKLQRCHRTLSPSYHLHDATSNTGWTCSASGS